MTIGGVLFSEMVPQPDWEADFHDWYDTEHIPVRMAAPGFIGAQRYRRLDGEGFLAVYDMEGPQALGTEQYRRIKSEPSARTARMLRDVSGFTRYTGRLLSWQVQEGLSDADLVGSDVLYPVFFTVPQDKRADFEAWYTEDHVPTLLAEPGWLGCRRYEIVDGAPQDFTHMALHHLTTADALESPARAVARATPWRARLAAQDWFRGTYMVFTKHGKRFTAR
jgi:hypothetical protein